jgi:transcriptional regulator with XRE-family HTH domain
VDWVHLQSTPKVDKKNIIPDRFREIRTLLGGLTQQQLADRLALSRNYIAKIESGKKEPSTRVLRSLEDLLRVHSVHPKSTMGAEEARSDYNGAALVLLRDQVEEELRGLLEFGGNDLGRLGWLREELRALSRRIHRQPDAEENAAVRDAVEAGRKKGFAKAGELRGQRPADTAEEAKTG